MTTPTVSNHAPRSFSGASQPSTFASTPKIAFKPSVIAPSPKIQPPPRNTPSYQSRPASTPMHSAFGSTASPPLTPALASIPAHLKFAATSIPQTRTSTPLLIPKPNYNVSIPTTTALTSISPFQAGNPHPSPLFGQPISIASGIMAPAVPAQPSWGGSTMKPIVPKQVGKDDWGDFDPLK